MLVTQNTFRRLCRARDLLADVQDEPLSVQSIAREIQISPFHFIRQFQSLFGQTPHQFRIRTRLDRAKVLLASGHHSVTEVCMEIGFSSLGTFSYLFTRRFGLSPSAYQRSARVLVQVAGAPPGALPHKLFPGCLSLMGSLPPDAFRNFEEASLARLP
jgi:AraC-like DNA-binding protein